MKLFSRGCILAILLLPLTVQFSYAANFKPKLRVYIIKTLERELARIEKSAMQSVTPAKQSDVKNVTLQMQVFIEDVVLAYGREVTIEPAKIYDKIIAGINSGAGRNATASELVVLAKTWLNQ